MGIFVYMSYKVFFGKHNGKSLEWLFFNEASYAQWLITEEIEGRWEWRDRKQGEYFHELYRRASHLTGICPWCKQRPITRMSLSTHYRSGRLGAVGFDCDECEYLGGTPTAYFRPSFIAPYRMPKTEQLMIVDAIRAEFIGDGKLTQARMEQFFLDDRYFPNATPGFFAADGLRVVEI